MNHVPHPRAHARYRLMRELGELDALTADEFDVNIQMIGVLWHGPRPREDLDAELDRRERLGNPSHAR